MSTLTLPRYIAENLAEQSPVWGDPERCAGMCHHASMALARALIREGHQEVTLLGVQGMNGNHYAVLLDQVVYDLTWRQFEADAAFPLIESNLDWGFRAACLFVRPTFNREYL